MEGAIPWVDKEYWRKLFGIAVPLMVAEAINSILWITDTYFVGRLGDYAIAAVGIGGYLSWLVFTIASPLYIGSLVLTAQAIGEGSRGKASRIIGELLLLSIIISIIVLLVFHYETNHLVELLAGSRVAVETKNAAQAYFKARLLGVTFLYMGIVFDSAYRGAGVSKPILYATLLSSITNIILDPLLIYGLLGFPSLGVEGAGLASAIAYIVYFTFLSSIFSRVTKIRVKLAVPTHYARQIIVLGLPMLAERLGTVTAHLFYLGAIARCGNLALAAHTIGVRIESLAFLPLFSLAEATASIIGQLIGKGSIEEAYVSGLKSLLVSLNIGALSGILLASLAPYLPRLFTGDPITVSLAGTYLAIAAASEPFLAVSNVLLMSIRGAGEARIPFAVNIGSLYSFRVAGSLLLLGILACTSYLQVIYFWIIMLSEIIFRSIISIILFIKIFKKNARKII